MVKQVRRAVVISAASIMAVAPVCGASNPTTRPTDLQVEANAEDNARMESEIADLRAQLRQQRSELQRTKLQLMQATASFRSQLDQLEADLRRTLGNTRASTQPTRS